MDDLPSYKDIESTSRKHNKREKKIDEYDLIVEIDSIRNLNKKGWKIIYNEKKNFGKEIIQDIIENGKKTIVAVLGNSNRGKTHILHKLSEVNFPSGYQIQTKGLSIKIFDKHYILLDTAGSNAPLLIDENLANYDRPTQKEIDNIHLCQIIANYILQSFIINQSHILICVVGMLTVSEQLFLEKIKKISKGKKQLIIIHNLIKCKTNEEIKKYKDEILLKMISSELLERDIPDFDFVHEKFFNKYFIEKNDENIKHFIYCNDDENNEGNVVDYYNKTTLKFIKKCMRIEIIKPTNIIKNLIEHIKEISSSVLKEEIKSIELSKEKDLITCTNVIEPREIIYDGPNDIIFLGKEFEPMYRYYTKEKYFIIEIDICSKYNNLIVKHVLD